MRLLPALLIAALLGAAPQEPPRNLSDLLKPLREKHKVPAFAGAIVTSRGAVAIGVDGIRRRGSEEPVGLDDRFHLGSCAKAMTATVLARLVEEKKLAWDTKVVDLFNDLKEIDAGWNGATIEHLLSHRAGAPANFVAEGSTPTEARRALARDVLRRPPVNTPGTAFLYSNTGYALAGAAAEKVTGIAWEELMRARLFEPLGMKSAGFGAPGVDDKVDQPRGHNSEGKPVDPGPAADNPPGLAPAGTVHASIGDWARFVALHLRKEGLIGPETFSRLHTPPGNERYAMGWIVERDGVLAHEGSNTLWHAFVLVMPRSNAAVLVATNTGEPHASAACAAAAEALLREHLRR